MFCELRAMIWVRAPRDDVTLVEASPLLSDQGVYVFFAVGCNVGGKRAPRVVGSMLVFHLFPC